VISEGYETLREGIERLIESNEQAMGPVVLFCAPEKYEYLRSMNERLKVILAAGKAAENDRRR
jgi:hypothetical protein